MFLKITMGKSKRQEGRNVCEKCANKALVFVGGTKVCAQNYYLCRVFGILYEMEAQKAIRNNFTSEIRRKSDRNAAMHI